MFIIVVFVSAIFVCVNGNVRSAAIIENTAACQKWYDDEPDPSIFLEETRKCPCYVPTNFPKKYSDGSKIWQTDAGCSGSSQSDTCHYHQGAHGCYRFAYKSKGPGAQCCYDKAGVWISDPFEGAGTLDRERAPDNILNLVQWNAHNKHDVKPWEHCCKDSDMPRDVCQLYFDKRPPGECVDY